MGANIIGRFYEKEVLKNCYESDKAELIAVYGRRRIGKTFLIKQFFKDKFNFYITGIYKGTIREQLKFFNSQLCEYSGIPYPIVNNWYDAFNQLKHYLSSIKKQKIVVFFDELPWLDTHGSRFVKAFELFWNSWAADQDNLKFIICGSATTWIMNNIIGNKGGLHNRVTRSIKLSAFSLSEVEQFLNNQGIIMNKYQIAELYMIMGGVPYYLQKLHKNYTFTKNIDRLFFENSAELQDEYSFLFRSLFEDSIIHQNIVEALSTKAKGMTRNELIDYLNLEDNGRLSKALDNLVSCDFLRKYSAFGKKQRGVIYQLTDLFTLFYLKFVKNSNNKDEHYWTNMIDSPIRRAWSGYAFEQLCLHHIPQIQKALGISGIQTNVCSWSTQATEEHNGAQIDLLIDRRDQVINLCEMKYSVSEYEITKQYNAELQSRKELFRKLSKTRKALHLTMLTTFGVANNAYKGMIQSEILLDDLFTK